MKKIYTIISFTLLGTQMSCGGDSENKGAESNTEVVESNPMMSERIEVSQTQFDLSKMELGKLNEQTFSEKIRTNGEIGVPPENQASISAYFGGYVKSISLLEGQRIKKGQTLFTLENPDYIEVQKNFIEYRDQLAYLKSDYERQKELVKDNVVSEKAYLKAETDYKVALVNYESLKKKLLLMNINPESVTETNLKSVIRVASPISGYVTSVNISKGMFLNPSDVAVKVVNTDHIHIELNIYEQDLPKVKIGQKVRFKLQNSDTYYNAKVHLINKVIDSESRLVNIHCHLEDETQTNLFTPGMYLEAEILTESKKSKALPENTVVNVEDKNYALILIKNENDTYVFDKVKVKVGHHENGYVEVLNDNFNMESAVFLVNGAFNLITE